ncbi:MAG: class II aldolase/adducin family protein [Halieaceae bacterium]|nr:class II aldolase/adducin family protein [Halieaceae bacterium]
MEAEQLRRDIVSACRRLAQSTLGSGTSGNISARDLETGLVGLSPSAMDYAAITPEDVVLMTLQGDTVDARRRPSSEWLMHLHCYRCRPDIQALVHTHSPAATAVAVLGRPLPAVHYMLALSGNHEIPLAPYHRFGSEALAQAAVEAMGEGRACLLANHGVLAGGDSIRAAWTLAEQIEYCADVYLRASAAGEPVLLSKAEMREVEAHFGSYTPQGD